jgi:hypothetical protein
VERDVPLYVPFGWPSDVNPPGISDRETTAADWLMGLVPEYRQRAAVRRHPLIYSPVLGRHEPQLSHELRSVEDKPEA